MTVAEKFWARVDSTAGPQECWPWVKATQLGYGRVWHEDKALLAHRVAYTLAVGPIPEGLFVMHSCDNPPCCNPAHLSVGTARDNQLDMWAKGRSVGHFAKGRIGLRGELCSTSKITAQQVREMRSRSTGTRGESVVMAEEYGISCRHVRDILAGRRWAHLTQNAEVA